MKDLVVHSIPGSPFGRAVLVTLEEKGARYRLAALSPAAMRSPEHLALHPFGRLPVLEHGAFRLYETQAIVRYLDRVLPGPALTPAQPEAAARMDQLLNINDWYLFPNVARIVVFERIIAPFLLGKAPDEQAIAAALPAGKLCVDELNRLLGANAYFAGAEFSLADILLAPQL